MFFVLILVGVVYLVPAIKLMHVLTRWVLFLEPIKPPTLAEFQKKSWFLKMLMPVAQVEYHLYPVRFYLLGVPFIMAMIAAVLVFTLEYAVIAPLYLLGGTALCLVICSCRASKTLADLKTVELLRTQPKLHPVEFYGRYKLNLAFGGLDLVHAGDLSEVTPEYADFRKGQRAKKSRWIMLKCFIDTAHMAHLVLLSLKKMGPSYAALIFDNAGALWGKRILQLCQTRFQTKGHERLEGKQGRFLFIMNHKSSLDFVFSFFSMSHIMINHRPVAIRFVVAKDHFKDNKFIYSVMGVGKAIEAAGMVFISRKNKKQSFMDLKSAAISVTDKPIDVTIFPQGTRASGKFDRAGKRRDAGYYTTFNRKNYKQHQAHLRKGTSHLILDTLQSLHERHVDLPLHLVFVGIKGAGTIMPKGVYNLQSEGDVEFAIGDVVTLSPSMISDIVKAGPDEAKECRREMLSDLNSLIDHKLTEILGIHVLLTQRYLTELQGQFRFDQAKINSIKAYIESLSGSTTVVYQILDRIYSLPLMHWNGFLSELSQLLLEETVPDRLWGFCEEVGEELLKVA